MGLAHLYLVNTLPARRATIPAHVISIGDWRGGPRAELSHLTGRELSLSLTEPSRCSFSINGADPQAALLAEGISDVWWVREGVPIFRGRLVSATDTVDETTHEIACECVDYRGLLDQRVIVSPDENHPGEANFGREYLFDDHWKVEDIAWDLVADAQTLPGGNLGITKGIVTPTGQTKDVTFRDGDTILACLNTLSQSDPGFEFTVDTDRKFNLYYPRRGADRGVTLDHGGLVAHVTRTVDLPSTYANWTRSSGDIQIGVDWYLDKAVPDLGNRPEGRWDKTFPNAPELLTASALAGAAARNFAVASDTTPRYDLGFRPGAWLGPSHVWVGDTITARVQSGRLNVGARTRVQTVNLSLDQSNVETVSVTVGPPPLADPGAYIARTLRQLTRS